jgi:CheY-like chemotaxis protein
MTSPPKGTCILIVEDDADQRESLADVLQAEGYRVAGAADGQDALAHLRNNPAPCIILLDLMMPVMKAGSSGNSSSKTPASPRSRSPW